MKSEIINYIKRNRVTSTEVADCLGKSGCLENVFPLNRGHFKVGNIKWVYAHSESNWDVHEQIQSVHDGDIVMVEEFGCNNRALFGQLVSKYLLLYKQAAAIVVCGKMRDAAELYRENYPIWCKGVTPIGCFNSKPDLPLDEDLLRSHKLIYDGSIAVCDDCGVVIIPQKYHTEEFLQKLIDIEEQEDTWFDRLDRKKESTFEIVCLKTYLSDIK